MRLPIILIASMLSACGGSGTSGGANPGDGGGPSPTPSPAPSPSSISHSGSCVFITGGATKVSSMVDSGCLDCSVSDAAKAIDGDASTTASINESQATPSAGVALRATAQAGIVYPAGAHAGAKMTLPGATGPSQTAGVTLRTYLGDTLQETHSVATPQICGTCNSGQVPTSQNFETTKPFDAVEVYIYGGNGASTLPAKVAEFCSDW